MEAGSKQPQDRAVSGQQRSRGAEADTRETKPRSSVPRRLNSTSVTVTVWGSHTQSPPPGPATRPVKSFLENAPHSAPLPGSRQRGPGHRGRTWSPGSTGGRRWRAARTPAAACRSPPAAAAPSAAPAPFPEGQGGGQRVSWLDGTINSGQEFEQTPGDGEGQGGQVCCSLWGHKESDTTGRLNKEAEACHPAPSQTGPRLHNCQPVLASGRNRK